MSWTRTLYLLWTAQFFATAATSLGLAVIPFFLAEDPLLAVRDHGLRVLYTGLIFGGPFVTAIIATPLWGFFADQTGRKPQVVRAAVGLGLTQLLIGFVRSPEQLVVLRVVQGAVAGIVAANLGFLSASVSSAHQTPALVRLQSANPVATICGPLFGSVLATTIGYRPVHILFGGLVVVCGVVMAVVLREPPGQARAAENPWRGIGQAIATVARRPPLRRAFGVLLLTQLATSTTQVVFAIYAGMVIDAWVAANGATRSYFTSGVGFAAIGMVTSGVSNFIAASYWGRARTRENQRQTPLAAIMLATSNLLLAFWPPYWAVLLARIGIGAGMGGIGPLQYAAIGRHVGVQQRGRYMGLATATTHVGSLIGFFGCGALARQLGLTANFVLSAALFAIVCAISWRTTLNDHVSGP